MVGMPPSVQLKLTKRLINDLSTIKRLGKFELPQFVRTAQKRPLW